MTAPTRVEHRYSPRGAARQLFSERGPEVLMDGPAGTGKTMACLERLNMLALTNPGMRGLIVRKTGRSLGATTLVTWEKLVIPEILANKTVTYFGGNQRKPPQYQYSNGSLIMIGGLDKASKIMSSEYDIIYAGESTEFTEDDFEALTTRLRYGRLSFQQLLADCNPDRPTHWLNQRCNRGQTRRLLSRHKDNPRYYTADGELTEEGRDYIEGKLARLTGARRGRLYAGQWSSSEGVIYEAWDNAGHVVDRFWPDPTWRRMWAVDFGHRNPFVWQDWAVDNDGEMWLHREIYLTGRLVEDHARQILRYVTRLPKGVDGDGEDPLAELSDGRRVWREPKPWRIVCDHDAEGRATLERHLGMSTVAANKTVLPGIEAVAARLRFAEGGKPRLHLMRDARQHDPDPVLVEAAKPTCTVEEFPGYVWDTGAGKALKEAPLKENDHSMDALRYAVVELDLAPSPNVRFM